jgi:Ca2+:H+ antiporter
LIFKILSVFIPVSIVLKYVIHAPDVWIFLTAIIGITPLADWIRQSTEQLSLISGPAIGGLLNVTFGNASELILAIFVLLNGNSEVVKAQITGSIIGNGLLGLGLAVILGSINKKVLHFDRERSGMLSNLLILSVIALILPALFDYTEHGLYQNPNPTALDESLSLGVAIVLLIVYAGNLFYTLVTHNDIYKIDEDNRSDLHASWPLWRAIVVILVATALIALESELISGALEHTAEQIGVSTFFLGVILLAVVGNAAEYATSIFYARRDQMSMVFGITVGSTVQVALLIAPVLVIVSFLIGHPMNLVFANPLELVAITGVAFTVNAIAHDGQTNWFEGLLLLAVYVILGIAFFYV